MVGAQKLRVEDVRSEGQYEASDEAQVVAASLHRDEFSGSVQESAKVGHNCLGRTQQEQ